MPDDLGYLDEVVTGPRRHHPRPSDPTLGNVLVLLAFLGTLFDAAHSMWPSEGMVWYGALVLPISVEEGMADICRRQGGVPGRTDLLATCVEPLGRLLWTVEIGPRKPE